MTRRHGDIDNQARALLRILSAAHRTMDRRGYAPAPDRSTRRRNPRPQLTVDDPRHGTLNGYRNYGCRCDDCRACYRVEYQRQRAVS